MLRALRALTSPTRPRPKSPRRSQSSTTPSTRSEPRNFDCTCSRLIGEKAAESLASGNGDRLHADRSRRDPRGVQRGIGFRERARGTNAIVGSGIPRAGREHLAGAEQDSRNDAPIGQTELSAVFRIRRVSNQLAGRPGRNVSGMPKCRRSAQ